jgi:VIT1/CCC1 family predicted Fe2+/Mn2+ transporter
MTPQTILAVSAAVAVVSLASVLFVYGRPRRGLNEPNMPMWRFTMGAIGAGLTGSSLLTFLAYGCRNAYIGGDKGGDAFTVPFMSTGTALALFGLVVALGSKGKLRWLTFGTAIALLLVWFASGLAL